MIGIPATQKLSRKVVEALMIEALLLNDELRSYFEGEGRDERALLDPLGQVTHASEAVNATTRMMHITAWLMSHRARLDANDTMGVPRLASLGKVSTSDMALLGIIPPEAQRLVRASLDLFERVGRLDRQLSSITSRTVNPAGLMLKTIEQRLAAAKFD